MGRVEAFSIDGLEMWFWSDEHEPPHFHAKRAGEWEISVSFLETTSTCLAYDTKWGSGPSGRMRVTIAQLVVAHRQALLDEWERKTQRGG